MNDPIVGHSLNPGAAEPGKAVGDQKLLRGVQTRPEIVVQRQRNAQAQKAAAHFFPMPRGLDMAHILPIQHIQQKKIQGGAHGAGQENCPTGTGQVSLCPDQKKKSGEEQGENMLPKLDHNQLSDFGAGGKISGQNSVQTGKGEKKPHDLQGQYGVLLPQQPQSDWAGEEKQNAPGGGADQNSVA